VTSFSTFTFGVAVRGSSGSGAVVVASGSVGAKSDGFAINIISPTVIAGSDRGSADVALRILKPENDVDGVGLRILGVVFGIVVDNISAGRVEVGALGGTRSVTAADILGIVARTAPAVMRVTTITPSPQVALLFTSSGSVADTRSARLLPIGLEKRCSCVSALEERHKPPASRKRARCNREKSPWARATFASTSSIKLDTNSLPLAQRVRRKAQGLDTNEFIRLE